MRKPKVENKYNLTMKKINNLKVGDESKIKKIKNHYSGEIM